MVQDMFTTGGAMFLDGDIENSSTDDGDEQEGSAIAATDGRTVRSPNPNPNPKMAACGA